MLTHDARTADCLVYTEKEGLLSPVAHDLCIRVSAFAVTLDDAGALTARFDASSLRVLHAVKGGHPAPSALSPGNKAEIEGNIRKDVLASDRFPEIVFRAADTRALAPLRDGSATGAVLAGELELRGQRRPLSVRVETRGERLVAEAQVHQPDFGIKPYSAMLGTLKVKASVRVELSLPRA